MLCKLLLLSALNLSKAKGICEFKKKDPSWAEKGIDAFEIFVKTHKNDFCFKAISWHGTFFNSSSWWKHLTDEWVWLCLSCIDVLLLMWVQDMVNLWCCDCVYLHCTALERVFLNQAAPVHSSKIPTAHWSMCSLLTAHKVDRNR